MEENIKNESKNNQQHFAWKVLGIFVLTLILICGFVFIFNYNIAYDGDAGAGWLPPSFAVVYYYFLLTVAGIITSIILKVVLKKRVRIWALLLVCVFVPIICYNFNYNAFKKDGPFHFLVDKGGIFHFIAIGDYNFDGMNDEFYHINYEEREYSSRYGGHFDDTIVDYIDTNSIGTGGGLSGCFCFYDWEERVIELFLDKDSVKLKQVEILVSFQDKSIANNVSFYLDGRRLSHTVNKYGVASIIFDANACLKLQNRIGGKNRYIPIKYVVKD